MLASPTMLTLPMSLAHAAGATLGQGPVARFALPPWTVWVAGAAVVAVSFLLVAAFLTRPTAAGQGVRAASQELPARTPVGAQLAQWAALSGVLMALVPAFAGDRLAGSLLPFSVAWLLGWTLLPAVAYLFGDGAWRSVHPWMALGRGVDGLVGRRRRVLQYPSAWGAWPAVAVLLLVIGLEVWGNGRLDGDTLSRWLTIYVVFTIAGMAVFGSEAWLRQADFHTRLLSALAAAAPLDGGRLRRPWIGLRRLETDGRGEVAFLVALLYGVNFDGFLSTSVGASLLARLEEWLPRTTAFATLLLLGYLVFVAAFFATARGIRRRSESVEPTGVLAARFAASLVPIALVYHAAHNMPYLAETAPSLVRAALDPFGLGWSSNLLATLPESIVLGEQVTVAVSITQILLIVIGHVFAVVVAHDLALVHFPSVVQAFRSEIPLTQVMVFYTLVGLWIVATATHGGAP